MTSLRAHNSAIFIIFCALILSGIGCGWAKTPIYSFGQYEMPREEMFGRLTQTLRSRGYQATSVDMASGTIAVPSSYLHRGSQSTFTIQCYADGWVSVRMTGAWVRPDGSNARVPRALKSEYDTLVVALSESLGPTSGAENGG